MKTTVLTYEDFAALPDDGTRYELHEGELSVTPGPTPARRLSLSGRGIEGAPTLAIEVLSPSTTRINRHTKMALPRALPPFLELPLDPSEVRR